MMTADYVSTFTIANAGRKTAAAQVRWIVEMEETASWSFVVTLSV